MEEQKLTGTGAYDLDAYQSKYGSAFAQNSSSKPPIIEAEDEMETYSEDDFEESGDDGDDSDMNMADQTQISQEILAKTQAGQATELQRVVQAYN